MLVSLGGCEPQAAGHVAANLRVGNDRSLLVAVTTQLLPFIGYPRTLNALRVINVHLSLFVPPRASLLASSATVHAEQTPSGDGEPLPRSYFTYEFALGRALCVLVAAAKRGKVRLGSHSVLTEIRV
jgi:hypothetical protein